jgi:paired small multidrug resistance pump
VTWIFLLLAGALEMFGVMMIHKTHMNRNWQSVFLLISGFGLSFFFLTLAMKSLPMGTAYAVWTGIGAAGGALLGIVFYGEPRDWKRLLFIAMILGATIGLKLLTE